MPEPERPDDEPTPDVEADRIAAERATFAGRPWYDPTAFGAVGDGEADDASALQAAADAAAADGGGAVFLPAGDYRVASAVTLRDGVRVRGAGAGATTLVADGEGYAAVEAFGTADDPVTDVTVADLAVDCSALGDGGADAYDTGEKCVYFQYVRRCQIRGVYAYGAPATGIGTDFMVDSLVHGCVAERNGREWADGRIGANGIGIGAGRYAAETVVVSDCHALDNGNNGVMFEAQGPPDEAVHAGLMAAVGCTARGNRVGFRDSGDRRVTFSACSAVDNDEHGVVVSDKGDTPHGAAEHRVADCRLADNGGHGLAVVGSASEANLSVTDTTAADNGGRGVSVATGEPASGVTVADCAAYRNGASGIVHAGGGDAVAVRDCRAASNGRAGNPDDADGVRLDADGGRYRGVRLTGNDCVDGDDPTQRRGAALLGDHEAAVVAGNAFVGNAAAAVAYDGDPPAVRRGNIGYRTENAGRATVRDGETVAHGLAERPSAVTLQSTTEVRAYPRAVDDERITVGLSAAGEPDEGDEAVEVFWTAAAV